MIETPPAVVETAKEENVNISIEETSIRDSYQETKEEIEDSLEFIKSKLNPPEPPAKAKRASKEIKQIEEEATPALTPVVIPLPIVVPSKSADVLENKKEIAAIAKKEAEPVVEKFATDCIPPVRPERLKRNSAKLNVPDWQPPKQNIFSYIFGCFKSQPSQ